MRLAAGLLLCIAACGRTHWEGGDPDLFGVLLEADADAPFASAPDFRPRLKHVLDATSRYFGHDPSELAGLRIIARNHWIDCPGVAGKMAGCYTPDDNTVQVAMAGFGCLEGTAVPHELLHYFIGDLQHHDPLWRTFAALWPGLVPAGCQPFSTE